MTKPLSEDQLTELRAGIRLDEGLATLGHLRPQTGTEVRGLAELLDPPPARLAWYRATLRQGWKRQLRRMFAATGAPIERLVRVRLGTVRLGVAPIRHGPPAHGRRGRARSGPAA